MIYKIGIDFAQMEEKIMSAISGSSTTSGWGEVGIDRSITLEEDLNNMRRSFNRFIVQLNKKAPLAGKFLKNKNPKLVFDIDTEVLSIIDNEGRIYARKPLNEENTIEASPEVLSQQLPKIEPPAEYDCRLDRPSVGIFDNTGIDKRG